MCAPWGTEGVITNVQGKHSICQAVQNTSWKELTVSALAHTTALFTIYLCEAECSWLPRYKANAPGKVTVEQEVRGAASTLRSRFEKLNSALQVPPHLSIGNGYGRLRMKEIKYDLSAFLCILVSNVCSVVRTESFFNCLTLPTQ